MIPITKNIIVVDEFGTEYEPTYLKRANGLVKNGRARFISYNRICLTRPPDIFINENSEETSVDNNINYKTETAALNGGKPEQVTVESILARIDTIIEGTGYIHKLLSTFNGGSNVPGGIQNVVEARETTNQRIVNFLERIYDDISTANKTPGESENMTAFKMFVETISNYDIDDDNLIELLVGGPGTGGGALKYFFGRDSIYDSDAVPHRVYNHYNGQSNWNQPKGNPTKPPKTTNPPRGWRHNGFSSNVGNIVNKAMEQVGQQMGDMFNQPPYDDFDDDSDDSDD